MQKNIESFFSKVENKVLLSFKQKNFHSLQVSLLEDTYNRYKKKSEVNLYGTSLAIFYYIVKNWEKEIDEQAYLLGSFCTLYVLALDIFDDAQDNDLNGKTYETVGIPIAINNALTLLFLSLEFLSKSIELESDSNKKTKYLDIFTQASIIAVRGQHIDLMGKDGVKTTNDVLNMQRDKASSISIIAQCAALYSDCTEEEINKYKEISQKMVLIFQIVNDIRDIYGKKLSPDLLTNKITYPIACFLEKSDNNKINLFNNLKKQLPESIKEIRRLIYDSGSLLKCSEVLETMRKEIHSDFASMKYSPSIRTLIYTIDSLTSTIYKVPFLEESNKILSPNGKWHIYINNLYEEFFSNLSNFNPPPKISLIPWHLPHWMYDLKREIIFYSDIEGQPEEILYNYSNSIGINDLDKVKSIVESQAPFFVSHELFHYWRKYNKKITSDYWYEELVCNTLALSYLQSFYKETYNEILEFVNNMLINNENLLSEKGKDIANKILSKDFIPGENHQFYEVNSNDMRIIQLMMLRYIFKSDLNLKDQIAEFI